MPATSQFFAKSFYGIPRAESVAADILSNGLVVRSDTAAKTASVTRMDAAALNTGGAIGTILIAHTFKVRVPEKLTGWAGFIRCRARWDVVAASPAGGLGRLNFNIQRNGASISGLTKYTGRDRALDAITNFTEVWMIVAMPAAVSYLAGDTLDFIIELENRAAIAGNTLTFGLRTDPAVAGNELVFEFDIGAP